MIIRSQCNRKIVINPKTITIDSGLQRYFLYADDVIIGSYKSESRAIEEVDAIEKAINNKFKNYTVGADY